MRVSRHMKNTSQSVQEAIALRRMSLVQALIELIQCHWPLSAALEQVADVHGPPRFGEEGARSGRERAAERAAMFIAVQRPFEAFGNVKQLLITRILHGFRPIYFCSSVRDFDMSLACQRFHEHEQVCHSMSFILIIIPFQLAWLSGQGRLDVG